MLARQATGSAQAAGMQSFSAAAASATSLTARELALRAAGLRRRGESVDPGTGTLLPPSQHASAAASSCSAGVAVAPSCSAVTVTRMQVDGLHRGLPSQPAAGAAAIGEEADAEDDPFEFKDSDLAMQAAACSRTASLLDGKRRFREGITIGRGDAATSHRVVAASLPAGGHVAASSSEVAAHLTAAVVGHGAALSLGASGISGASTAAPLASSSRVAAAASQHRSAAGSANQLRAAPSQLTVTGAHTMVSGDATVALGKRRSPLPAQDSDDEDGDDDDHDTGHRGAADIRAGERGYAASVSQCNTVAVMSGHAAASAGAVAASAQRKRRPRPQAGANTMISNQRPAPGADRDKSTGSASGSIAMTGSGLPSAVPVNTGGSGNSGNGIRSPTRLAADASAAAAALAERRFRRRQRELEINMLVDVPAGARLRAAVGRRKASMYVALRGGRAVHASDGGGQRDDDVGSVIILSSSSDLDSDADSDSKSSMQSTFGEPDDESSDDQSLTSTQVRGAASGSSKRGVSMDSISHHESPTAFASSLQDAAAAKPDVRRGNEVDRDDFSGCDEDVVTGGRPLAEEAQPGKAVAASVSESRAMRAHTVTSRCAGLPIGDGNTDRDDHDAANTGSQPQLSGFKLASGSASLTLAAEAPALVDQPATHDSNGLTVVGSTAAGRAQHLGSQRSSVRLAGKKQVCSLLDVAADLSVYDDKPADVPSTGLGNNACTAGPLACRVIKPQPESNGGADAGATARGFGRGRPRRIVGSGSGANAAASLPALLPDGARPWSNFLVSPATRVRPGMRHPHQRFLQLVDVGPGPHWALYRGALQLPVSIPPAHLLFVQVTRLSQHRSDSELGLLLARERAGRLSSGAVSGDDAVGAGAGSSVAEADLCVAGLDSDFVYHVATAGGCNVRMWCCIRCGLISSQDEVAREHSLVHKQSGSLTSSLPETTGLEGAAVMSSATPAGAQSSERDDLFDRESDHDEDARANFDGSMGAASGRGALGCRYSAAPAAKRPRLQSPSAPESNYSRDSHSESEEADSDEPDSHETPSKTLRAGGRHGRHFLAGEAGTGRLARQERSNSRGDGSGRQLRPASVLRRTLVAGSSFTDGASHEDLDLDGSQRLMQAGSSRRPRRRIQDYAAADSEAAESSDVDLESEPANWRDRNSVAEAASIDGSALPFDGTVLSGGHRHLNNGTDDADPSDTRERRSHRHAHGERRYLASGNVYPYRADCMLFDAPAMEAAGFSVHNPPPEQLLIMPRFMVGMSWVADPWLAGNGLANQREWYCPACNHVTKSDKDARKHVQARKHRRRRIGWHAARAALQAAEDFISSAAAAAAALGAGEVVEHSDGGGLSLSAGGPGYCAGVSTASSGSNHDGNAADESHFGGKATVNKEAAPALFLEDGKLAALQAVRVL